MPCRATGSVGRRGLLHGPPQGLLVVTRASSLVKVKMVAGRARKGSSRALGELQVGQDEQGRELEQVDELQPGVGRTLQDGWTYVRLVSMLRSSLPVGQRLVSESPVVAEQLPGLETVT